MGTSTFWFKSDKSVELLLLDYISLHHKHRFSVQTYGNNKSCNIPKFLMHSNLTLIKFIWISFESNGGLSPK